MTTNNATENPLPAYMTSAETAAFLKISLRTLARLYIRREGPPMIRYGRKIVYKRTSVTTHAKRRSHAQTGRVGPRIDSEGFS